MEEIGGFQMNSQEAKNILGLSGDCSDDEIKKSFRKLAAKFHPDRNKDPDAENQFKKVNEAFQTLTKPQSQQSQFDPFQGGGGNPFADIFTHFGGFGGFGGQRERSHPAPPIQISVDLDFKESILGTKKNLKFKRNTRCESCVGQGSKQTNNGCVECGGSGRISRQTGNTIMFQTCKKCGGRQNPPIPCIDCSQKGIHESETEINLKIPGGVSNGGMMRLSGIGNFAGNFGNSPQHADVFVELKIAADPELRLENDQVVSDLKISLLEALEGCEKEVKTVLGNRKIEIPSLTKNKDMIMIEGVGVVKERETGPQRVNLEIFYPEDPTLLIKTLKKISKSTNKEEN